MILEVLKERGCMISNRRTCLVRDKGTLNQIGTSYNYLDAGHS